MGKLFAWLDRSKGETIRDYDNRINHLQAFHAGYAFLSLVNYREDLSAFSAYAVWNGEFNDKLENPLPSGGYMMHCDMQQAQSMCERPEGFPLFVKLLAKKGRLYADRMILADGEQIFDFYFNGCEVIPPERLDLVFAGAREPEDAHREEYTANEAGENRGGSYRRISAGGSYTLGSYRPGSYAQGAFGTGSYGPAVSGQGSYWHSSYRLGSYWQGSYRLESFWQGSYWHGSYWHGSYQTGTFRYAQWQGSYAQGSYRLGSYRHSWEWEWWRTAGSFSFGSFSLGSFRLFLQSGSYRTGSFQMGSYRMGSFRVSSYRRGSFSAGSGALYPVECVSVMYDQPALAMIDGAAEVLYPESSRICRIIEEMGYGLDLI